MNELAGAPYFQNVTSLLAAPTYMAVTAPSPFNLPHRQPRELVSTGTTAGFGPPSNSESTMGCFDEAPYPWEDQGFTSCFSYLPRPAGGASDWKVAKPPDAVKHPYSVAKPKDVKIPEKPKKIVDLEYMLYNVCDLSNNIVTKLINAKKDTLNFTELCKSKYITSTFIEMFIDRIDFTQLIVNPVVSANNYSILAKFAKHFNWDEVCKTIVITNTFIEQFNDNINWDIMVYNPTFEESMFETYNSKIYFPTLDITKRDFSVKFIDKYYNHIIMDTDEKIIKAFNIKYIGEHITDEYNCVYTSENEKTEEKVESSEKPVQEPAVQEPTVQEPIKEEIVVQTFVDENPPKELDTSQKMENLEKSRTYWSFVN